MIRADNEIPSLHGLRAISILFVMVAHGLGFSHYPYWVRFFFQHGELGVRIFFIISGFLITTLLLRERERFGEVSLKLFYLRRILRIFPAFYLFVGAIVVLWYTRLITLPPDNLAFMLTYTMNFARDGTWVTGHLWSLSVEEQFYLLWPLAIKFTNRWVWIAIAVIAVFAGIILRAVNTLAGVQLIDPALRYATPFVAGPIAMGCLLGVYAPTLLAWKRAVHALRGIWLFGAILLVLFLDGLDLGSANRFIALLTNGLLTLLVARFVMRLPGKS